MTPSETMTPAAHQMDLLAAGRCGRCAERVSHPAIVREAACAHCGSPLRFNGSDILKTLDVRQRSWRLRGYALVAVASFFAGALPLVQIFVQLAAIFILHVIVLRRGLIWLPPARRILARISIKLLGAAVATCALLLNVLTVPMVGLSAVILGAVGPLLTALYVEGGLAILRKRWRLEAERQRLRRAEWLLPLAALLVLFAALAASVAVVLGAAYLLQNAQMPGIRTLAEFLGALTF